MKFNDLLIKDSSGEKSVTVTAFVLGFIVINIKLLLSGMTIEGVKFSDFSGTDYGTSLAALGAVYIMRRHRSVKTNSEMAHKEEEV